MTVSWFFWMLVGFTAVGCGIGAKTENGFDILKKAICIICGFALIFVTAISALKQ